MPWLIEAYRTQHGPSFWREVLTVAMGTYPDADSIQVFVRVPREDDDIIWVEPDTGEIVLFYGHRESLHAWLEAECKRVLGDPEDGTRNRKYWRREGE